MTQVCSAYETVLAALFARTFAVINVWALACFSVSLFPVAKSWSDDSVNFTIGGAGDTAIRGVNVMQVSSGTILPGQTVLVRDGLVRYMADSSDVELGSDVTVVSGEGLYLAPGLADMHVHIETQEIASLFLAYGVTRVRVMWGAPEIVTLREQIAMGEVIGPDIYTAGPIIDGPPVYWPGSVSAATPSEGRQAVRDQVANGYDFIKVYSRLTPEVFAAIADEAQRWGIPVAGHVPDAVSIPEALAAGMASMEHMLGYDSLTLADGVELGERRSAAQIAIGRTLVEGKATTSDLLSTDRLGSLATAIAEAGTAVTPTLLVVDRLYASAGDRESLLQSPEIRHISKDTRAFWDPSNDKRRSALDANDMEALAALNTISAAQVLALASAGVPILVGSDTPNPFVFYGLGLHEEMERLVNAGFSAEAVVRMATLGAAEFLEDQQRTGRVLPGYKADLVLLRANPFTDVKNYREIVGVMKSGVWLDQLALEKLQIQSVVDNDS